MVNNKVIVWGVDNYNTLEIIRELGKADIDVFFLIKGHTDSVLTFKISIWKYLREKKNAVIFRYFSKDDSVPYKTAKKNRLARIGRDILLKRYRMYIVFILDKLGLRK